MNSSDNKIKNIYYMLCYVFNSETLLKINESKYSLEDFENIYDFFALLLCILLDRVIKKGTYKNYIQVTEELSKIKGKIDFTSSISKLSFKRCKAACTYDEFSNNNLINKIILTTINKLLRTDKLGKKYKPRLNRFRAFYNGVDEIDDKSISWNKIRYDRNNKAYSFIIYLCKMILDQLIVSGNEGKSSFKDFRDKQALEDLFEKFLRVFIKKNYPYYTVKSSNLSYNKIENYPFVPKMRTDISIIDEKNRRVFIIEAKFKEPIFNPSRANYFIGKNDKVYIREDLFQINTYVENYKKIEKTKKGDNYKEVYGCLVYAQTPSDPLEDSQFMKLNDNSIAVKTVDMTSNWEEIQEKIRLIVSDFETEVIK